MFNLNTKNMSTLNFNDLTGKIVNVAVSVGNLTDVKTLKVCKVKARSLLFIEVDKPNRKNIFRKVAVKDVVGLVNSNTETPVISIKKDVIPTKWESNWDSMGTLSPSVMNNQQRVAQFGHPYRKSRWYGK